MKTRNLAQKLKELRIERGMSQEYLADESRVGLRTIQRIENNESEPMGETLKRIANTLDVALGELVGDSFSETKDFKGTIIFLKKQLTKTTDRSEIKTFKKFIQILTQLKEKNLSDDQKEVAESFIQYLELEKIPSFNNALFKDKLTEFKKFLKTKLRLVPNNLYTTWTVSFGFSFAVGFSVQNGIDLYVKTGVVSLALLLITVGLILDQRIRRQKRSFSF